MAFNFVADSVIRGRAYPALARWPARPYTPEWREFGQHYPNTVPVDLHEHCEDHAFPYTLGQLNPNNHPNWYTIGLGFFNFSIDYFALMSVSLIAQLKDNKIKILFYYDEGDNPYNIKARLDSLCAKHGLSTDCYRFVSANTAADSIPGFAYLACDELLYWRRNKKVAATPIHTRPRGRDFTVLSRTHKWWRATAMCDLWRQGILDNSYWSYTTEITLDEPESENPIEVDTLNIRADMEQFLSGAPYRCDTMTASEHNDHGLIETAHYTNSYCNIILETHFDADGSAGAFLTEKTFKAIKHGQPFIIIGPAGSLAQLRQLGYRTFDSAIDNTYDTITNNTERWLAVVRAIQQVKQQDMHAWFNRVLADVEHNQQLFCSSKYDRLNTLYDKLLY